MRNMKFQFKDSKAIPSLKTRAKMSDNNIFSWGGGGGIEIEEGWCF